MWMFCVSMFQNVTVGRREYNIKRTYNSGETGKKNKNTTEIVPLYEKKPSLVSTHTAKETGNNVQEQHIDEKKTRQ